MKELCYVYKNSKRHSSWNNFSDAEKQLIVLRNKNSCTRLEIRIEPAEDNFNGQYF